MITRIGVSPVVGWLFDINSSPEVSGAAAGGVGGTIVGIVGVSVLAGVAGDAIIDAAVGGEVVDEAAGDGVGLVVAAQAAAKSAAKMDTSI
jgi:hypothetical protein